MRERFLTGAREMGANILRGDANDPPHPDRASLDPDAPRPWIIYDPDGPSGRPGDFAVSALARGAVFVSCPDFRPEVLEAARESGRPLAEIVEKPLPGLLPPPPAVVSPRAEAAAPAEPAVEEIGTTTAEHGLAVAITNPPPAPKRGGRGLAIGCAFAAIAAGIGIVATQTSFGDVIARFDRAPAASPVNVTAAVAPVVDDALEPPAVIDLDLDAEVDVPAKPVNAAKPQPKSQFGRLTIRGEAKHKNVYFDGKRMLGAGRRSFLVVCGAHTIAVTDKTAAKDVEVPCDGEYVVSQ